MAKQRKKDSSILPMAKIYPRKIPKFKPHNFSSLTREAEAEGPQATIDTIFRVYGLRTWDQIFHLLKSLGCDPSDPDAFKIGFRQLAMRDYGAGQIAFSPRRTNKNATNWTPAHDYSAMTNQRSGQVSAACDGTPVRSEHNPTTASWLAVTQFNNRKDFRVVELLAKPDALKLDSCARFLCTNNEAPTDKEIRALRTAMIEVYTVASRRRYLGKSKSNFIKAAKAAFNSLNDGNEFLERTSPECQRGLGPALGETADDLKGSDEISELSADCKQARMDLTPIMQRLTKTIERETDKGEGGGKKKRLRTLVESLADFWEQTLGRSIAPYVHAKRLDDRPAFIVGREGDFIELALALFCHVDSFEDTDVIATITNVHEDRLNSKSKAKSGL
jgi:hypothetical protein